MKTTSRKRQSVVSGRKRKFHWERLGDRKHASEEELRCCIRKTRYETEERAMRVARAAVVQFSVRLYCYRCPYCSGYHLTHKKEAFNPEETRKLVF